MKKTTILLILVFLVLNGNAQKKKIEKESFYVLDSAYNGTEINKAVYLLHRTYVNDTCWQFDMYHILGPLIVSVKSLDERRQVLNGKCTFYNKSGTKDSMGYYTNNKKSGDWIYFNDTGRAYLQKNFRDDILIDEINLIIEDSIRREKYKKDSIANAGKDAEIDAEFKGGLKGWGKYLSANIKYPERAMNFNIQGTVVVEFVVDKSGKTMDEDIAKSVEFSLDQEALRMIRQSPAWTPAIQWGRIVKAYRRQPITFKTD